MADKKLVLKNVEVSWVKLDKPAPKFKSDDLEYSICVKVDEQIKDIMQSYKLNKKTKSGKDSTFEGEEFIQISLDEKTKTGWVRYGEVYDEYGEPTKDPVGNGSSMNLFVSIGDSQYGNLIKLGHLEDMNKEDKEMFFNFGQVLELNAYEVASPIIKKAKEVNASVDNREEEELEIPLD